MRARRDQRGGRDHLPLNARKAGNVAAVSRRLLLRKIGRCPGTRNTTAAASVEESRSRALGGRRPEAGEKAELVEVAA